MKNIEILHEDDFCIVVGKPAGLAVQGGEGVKTSLDKILSEIRTPAPLLVHRLDKDTSGVLLAAKGKDAAARFSGLLGTGGNAVKQYIAVCAGCPEKKEGSIRQELEIHGRIKKSVTRYRVIKNGKLIMQQSSRQTEDASDCMEYSVFELELGTGRMHQIRRHLAMIGNPILGDDKYGNFSLNRKLRKETGLKRLLLHASRLIVNDKTELNIYAPLPEYFHQFTAGSCAAKAGSCAARAGS